jgi:hypothetical protein
LLPEDPVWRACVSASAYSFAAGEPSSIVTPGSTPLVGATDVDAAAGAAQPNASTAQPASTLTHTLGMV